MPTGRRLARGDSPPITLGLSAWSDRQSNSTGEEFD
jgi:hypothetical protein